MQEAFHASVLCEAAHYAQRVMVITKVTLRRANAGVR
jgi:hypothetical protein